MPAAALRIRIHVGGRIRITGRAGCISGTEPLSLLGQNIFENITFKRCYFNLYLLSFHFIYTRRSMYYRKYILQITQPSQSTGKRNYSIDLR